MSLEKCVFLVSQESIKKANANGFYAGYKYGCSPLLLFGLSLTVEIYFKLRN